MFRDSSAKGLKRPGTVPFVQRRTITEEVLAHLRDLLLKGVLKPGSRIDQAELASNFGVSTVPVREALLRLQSAGLVEVVPHRGVFVSEVSVQELLDIYTTRELLEEQAARLSVDHLTSEDIEELERLAGAMHTAASKKRLDELLALNREFHFTIYRASQRRHLLQLIEQLWDLSTRYAHLQLHTVPDRASEALYEIRSIVAACERKDADALGWMIRYKVHQTTTGLLQHMDLPETASGFSSVLTPVPPAPKKAGGKKRAKPAVKAKAATSGKKKAAKKAGSKKATQKAAKKVAKKVAPAAGRGKKARGKRGT